ncbi:MAG TPA: hypothetical protein VMW67_01245 [Desulfobacteria bacterium]|nr:hypothetical protein [Desulfobacteria bacterium]
MKGKMNERFWILISRVLEASGIVCMMVFLTCIFLPRDPPIEIASVKLLLPVSTSLGLIALGASILAIGLSISSGIKTKALTSLNFDEKMAMMTGYEKILKNLKVERDKIEDIIRNRQEINNKINNNESEELDDMIKNKKWVDQKDMIILQDWLKLEHIKDNKIGQKMEGILERCKHDLVMS